MQIIITSEHMLEIVKLSQILPRQHRFLALRQWSGDEGKAHCHSVPSQVGYGALSKCDVPREGHGLNSEATSGTKADFRRVPRARTCGRHHGFGYLLQMMVEASVEQRPITRRTMKTTCSPAKVLTAVTAMMLAGSLVGCDAAANALEIIDPSPGIGASSTVDQATAADALVQLESIPVKGRAPKTGYTRDEFGPAWADVDRNGCDTRNDILARDLTSETFKPGTNNCVVMTGTLADKYTGTTITFTRCQDTSSDVQIDHIVPLSDAWQKGAQQLNADQRKELANDPLNLMAADGPTNGAKGDRDAATWLPPNKAFRCEYVARQTAVKAKYRLWVTQAERDAIATILQGCG
ncbi:hypothetical protein QF038_002313 [Pseudarthrobacter sp. W1I19]|nr:hypothetical protein [Pseudarthrobacter sp. W1I19]